MFSNSFRRITAALTLVGSLALSGPASAQMPDMNSLFGGNAANPFAGQQANAWTNMMAPMGMMGGGMNPMVMMMNPANWTNPNAYAQMANPMSYMAMMNPMSYMAMMNPMTYLPMMNPNSYLQMLNPALGLAGVQPMGNVAAIDPNTYWQFLVKLLGQLHGSPETSDNFLEKLKELGTNQPE